MQVKRYWLFRLLPFLTILILFITIAYQFISLDNQSQAVRHQQTQKFAYSLTNLAAAEATRYITQKNNKDLQILIDDLSNDPTVRDATIYDKFGQIIYQSKQVLPLPVLLNLGDNYRPEADGVIPYIAELYVDGTKVGYLRISLEQKRILRLIQGYQDQGKNILAMLILLAFIAGIILTALSYRSAVIVINEIKRFISNFTQAIKQQKSKLFR